MSKTLNIAIFALALVAFSVLGLAAFGQYQLVVSATAIPLAERFALLPGIAVSTGVLIAALTFLRERAKAEIERRRDVSKVLLERAVEAYKTALQLLSDRNNSRLIWVRAARTILHAKLLGREIKSEEYKRAYDLEEERVRNDLYVALTLPDDQTGGRKPLPPQFFYGIDDWHTCPTLDEAAIKASANVTAYSVSIDSVPPQPWTRPLSPRSVVAIFDFIRYPKDYDDPLDEVGIWVEDWTSSHDVDQGARRYVAHTKQKHAVGGKLYEYSTK